MHIADLPEKLRVGQTTANLALIDHFDQHDRGILWMCCGSGKTVACAVNIEMRGEPITVVFTPYIRTAGEKRLAVAVYNTAAARALRGARRDC